MFVRACACLARIHSSVWYVLLWVWKSCTKVRIKRVPELHTRTNFFQSVLFQLNVWVKRSRKCQTSRTHFSRLDKRQTFTCCIVIACINLCSSKYCNNNCKCGCSRFIQSETGAVSPLFWVAYYKTHWLCCET